MWIFSFRQIILLKITSDHFPVVLDTSRANWVLSPIRFDNVLLDHESFKPSFSSWWNNLDLQGWEDEFMNKLKFIKSALIRWNKEVFVDVVVKYAELENKIRKLDEKKSEG